MGQLRLRFVSAIHHPRSITWLEMSKVETYRSSLAQSLGQTLKAQLHFLRVLFLFWNVFELLLLPGLHPQFLVVQGVLGMRERQLHALRLTELHDGIHTLPNGKHIANMKPDQFYM